MIKRRNEFKRLFSKGKFYYSHFINMYIINNNKTCKKVKDKEMDFRKLKIVKKLKGFTPRLKWLMFSKMQDLKIGARYIDFLISDDRKSIDYDNKKLESMVRETLIKEFSPNITKSKSYGLLVDAVVHNIKKKQLGEKIKID